MSTNKNAALITQLQEAIGGLRAEIETLKANPPAAKTRKETKAGKPRESMTYEVPGFFKAESKQPPQCLTLSKWAWDAYKTVGRPMTEPELFEALNAHADEWKRKHTQPIWHVWQYYRPRMISSGHVKMY